MSTSDRGRRDRTDHAGRDRERGDGDRGASEAPQRSRGAGAGPQAGQDVDPLAKADPALRVALDGKPDTTVRAILVLRDPAPADGAAPAELDPDDYADRRAWRVAQIEAQRDLIEERYGSVLADMRDRGLELVGGTMTPVVVVTGEASAVRDALSYDVVASATFEPLS